MSTNNPLGREGRFNPTSPRSSSGAADSFKGTPETGTTVFSPEDGSVKSSRASEYVRLSATPRATLDFHHALVQTNPQSDRDPFVVSDINANRTQKLSPTASVFEPPYSSDFPGYAVPQPAEPPEDGSIDNRRVDLQLVTHPQPMSQHVQDITSTEAAISRCLLITDHDHNHKSVAGFDVDTYLSSNIKMHRDHDTLRYPNGIFIRFVNIRDSYAAYTNLAGFAGGRYRVAYISPRDYIKAVEPGSGLPTIHEGQIYLSVFPTPTTVHHPHPRLEANLRMLLEEVGELYAFKIERTQGREGSLFSVVAEYCDNDASLEAVRRFGNHTDEDGYFQVCTTLYQPDMPSHGTASTGVISPTQSSASGMDVIHDLQRLSISNPQTAVANLSNLTALLNTPAVANLNNLNALLNISEQSPALQMHPAFGMVPIVYHGSQMTNSPYMLDNLPPQSHSAIFSPTPGPFINPTAPRSAYTPRGAVVPRALQPPARRLNANRITRVPFSRQNDIDNRNRVDVDRISQGLDIRTTIMLRNIPNRLEQSELKKIVDQSSWGKYDFMYLRIDFENSCNVGYAFINFVDVLDIIDFVHARANRLWDCYKSEKIAEVSYATYQGKDCLVSKFRNSAIMTEKPEYRPKLYYTLNGPRPDLAGHEEDFPGPDNATKMRRSCANAQYNGLYTPSDGQHLRDEQRRRRSQFDRGTPMAEAEEFGYDALVHHNTYSP
ncbi:RNA recognition motif 2-domain-containing protein [Nemania sp. FL0916]|nr:RNA recognition motif 2-domain-containing protein [Nemania sp. FL0916]